MSNRQSEFLRLPIGDGNLRAYTSWQDPDANAMVYVHGFGASLQGEKPTALENACARRGWRFVSFDFRGHGQSASTLLELRGTGLIADLESVVTHVERQGVRRIFLVGSSMGGWTSAWFARRHPERVTGCAFIAPALDFLRGRWNSLSQSDRAEWKRTGRHRIQNEWVDAEIGFGIVEEIDMFPLDDLISHWSTPLVIFHGTRDDVVPYRQSLAFVERVVFPRIEIRLFKDGDHRLVEFKEEMAESACALFEELTAQPV
jgi:pimeloyl-ACP methyl ester carboxylesterase